MRAFILPCIVALSTISVRPEAQETFVHGQQGFSHGAKYLQLQKFRLHSEFGSQYHLTRRQTDSAQNNVPTCTMDSSELSRRIAVTNCNPDFLAALQTVEGNDCDYFGSRFLIYFFRQLVGECGTDRNGTLCVLHRSSLKDEDQQPSLEPSVEDLADEILNLCFEVQTLPQTFENCSNDCQQALEQFSGRFGCCIHSMLSITDDNTAMVLTPQLWTHCGVTRPEPCADIPVLPEPREDVTCSHRCAVSQLFALLCKHISSKQLQIYEECGDVESALEIVQSCGFNDKGDHCGITAFDRQYILTVYNKCYRFYTSNTCPTECKLALLDMKTTHGCCVNNLNATKPSEENGIEALVTRYDLWATCDVETPGYCSFPSDVSVYDDLTHCSTLSCDDS